MVVDDDVLEKEDLYILDRMKEFISNEEVIRLAAAKQLMIFIERAVSASATSYFSFFLSFIQATRRRCHQDDGDSATESSPTNHTQNQQEAQIT
jgi:hypothetical protein